MSLDSESTHTSRSRLLEAGKILFAQSGYEQTSTAAIAREAGTSESQLIRYYGGKAGLLTAIFDNTWSSLNQQMQTAVARAASAGEALSGVVETMLEGFAADPEAAFLFAFEGRRVRGSGTEIALSKGFVEFQELLRIVVDRGRRDGTFAGSYNAEALATALMGAVEALLRERLMSRRANRPDPFNDAELKAVFVGLVSGLAPGVTPGA